MLDNEIDAFGRRLGLDGLSFGAEGLCAVALEDLGDLTIEPGIEDASDELLLVLAREPAPEAPDLQAALERAHWTFDLPYGMAFTVLRGRLVGTARLPKSRASASDLENALRLLIDETERLLRR